MVYAYALCYMKDLKMTYDNQIEHIYYDEIIKKNVAQN